MKIKQNIFELLKTPNSTNAVDIEKWIEENKSKLDHKLLIILILFIMFIIYY